MTRLESLAAGAGLLGIGVCSPEPFPEVEQALMAANANGRSGSLRFTFADPQTASNPFASFPWARSIVVSAHSYVPGSGDPGPAEAGTGRVARFATADHYRPLRSGLESMADELRAHGYRSEVVCDDNRLVDRAVAVRSGIAWWGKSAMVLAPGTGPWFLIGSVITDAQLPPTEQMVRGCGTCEACLPACPTGAIVSPGILDARRCLAAILQSPGPIPRHLREAMGDRWYGCDECLTACPPGMRLLETATERAGRVDLIDVLRTSDRRLRDRHAHFYVPRNDPRFLRRNALVALGNAPGPDTDLVLAGYVAHRDPLLRAHAVWALGRAGGTRAEAVLRRVAVTETDPTVRDEIAAALDRVLSRTVGTLD